MLEFVLNDKGIKHSALPKKEAIQVNKSWLDRFAGKVKETTGKYKVGDYLWEAFGTIQPAVTNVKAIELLKEKNIEPFYVFDESGKHCYYCEAEQYPDFFNSGLGVYLFPVSKDWTIIYAHDNAVYFVEV